MVALNTTDLSNITSLLGQIEGLSSNGSGSQNNASPFINSVFEQGTNIIGNASSGNSDGSVSEEDYKKIAQDAIKKILSMVSKEAGTAKKEVDGQSKQATSVTEKSKNLGIKLEGSFSEISQSISTQNDIVEEATQNITKVQEKVKEKQEKINEIVEKIQAAQEKLSQTQDPQEQAALLNEINGYATNITGITQSIQTEQATMDNLTATVEKTVEKMESGTENMTVVQEEGQTQIRQLTQESSNCSKDVTQTGVKGAQNKVTAETARAAAEAAASNIFTSSTVATKLNQTAADQDQASSTRLNGLKSNITKIMQGIGNLTNNTEVLSSFCNSIGSSIHQYVNAIGSWDSIANPVIESIGSFETVGTGVEELTQTVETDLSSIESNNDGTEQQTNTNNEGSKEAQTPQNSTSTQGSTATQGTTSSHPTDTTAIDDQKNNLLTPQFDIKKLGFGL